MSRPLSASVNVTLDNNGAATGQVGPVPTFTTWTVTRIGVDGASATNPRVKVFRNVASPGSYIDGTNKGNLDSSDYPGTLVLTQGETIVITWTGGTPGASQSARVEGVASDGLP